MSEEDILFRFPAQEALRWALDVQARYGWFDEEGFLLKPGVGPSTLKVLKALGFAIELGVQTGRCVLTPAGLSIINLL